MSRRKKAFTNFEENKNIAKLLILFRIWNNKSQTQIAKDIGVSFQQIQKYEKCLNRISAENLLTICKKRNWKIELFMAKAKDIFGYRMVIHRDQKEYSERIKKINKLWNELDIIGEDNYYNNCNPRAKELIRISKEKRKINAWNL